MSRRKLQGTLFLFMSAILTFPGIAQSSNCDEVHDLAQMARSRSIRALQVHHRDNSRDYRDHVVFAIRRFELTPKNPRAAEELLKLIPTDEEQELVIHSFEGLLCESESQTDVRTLSGLHDRMTRDLSRAVLLVPKRMETYVAYAAEAVQDPHSDYAIRMAQVCRAKHRVFVNAVETSEQVLPREATSLLQVQSGFGSTSWIQTNAGP